MVRRRLGRDQSRPILHPSTHPIGLITGVSGKLERELLIKAPFDLGQPLGPKPGNRRCILLALPVKQPAPLPQPHLPAHPTRHQPLRIKLQLNRLCDLLTRTPPSLAFLPKAPFAAFSAATRPFRVRNSSGSSSLRASPYSSSWCRSIRSNFVHSCSPFSRHSR